MIYEALNYITGSMNQQLNLSLGTREEKVVLSNLSSLDGTPSQKANEKLAAFLVNLEEEATMKNGPMTIRSGADISYTARPLNLNTYVMFASVFSDYGESLKFLSYTLRFFQAHAEFTPSGSSAFPAGISRLIFDLISMDYQTMSYIWGMIGMKYQPSVLYRMRLLTLAGDEITDQLPSVSGIDPTTNAR
jgi:hypothetical protein